MEQKDIEKFQAEAQACAEPLGRIKIEMGRVIAGQDQLIDRLLLALVADGHVLLEGVPGLAKTLAVKTLAQTLSGTFSRLQFTPDLLPADVIGTRIYNAETHEFSTRIGPVFANIVLADEINRTSPKTQASLLEAMEERQITIDGKTLPLPELFMVIATQNPVEQLGTYRLPEAQLDRFLMKISMGYPEKEKEEADIVRRALNGEPVKQLSPVTTREEIIEMKKELRDVRVHDDIMGYAVEIARNTRKSRYLTLGASPRAAIALVRAARSRAYLEGRSFTTPEDVAALAQPVLLHRLILSAQARLEGKKEKDVLQEAMRAAKVPVL